MRIGHLITLAALSLFAFAATGCQQEKTSQTEPTVSTGAGGGDHGDHDHGDHDHGDHDHGDHDHGDHEADLTKVKLNLAKLSVEDRKLAEGQKTCPVGGELLGIMGKPIKLDVDGTAIFICCRGCEKEVMENKEEFLAKLNSEDPGDADADDGDN
jgi:hypothetical protein